MYRSSRLAKFAAALVAAFALAGAGCVVKKKDDDDDDDETVSADAGSSGGSGGIGNFSGGNTGGSEDAGSYDDGGSGTTTGSKTCEEIANCIANCPDGDESCFTTCYESGTAEAQRAFDSYAQCYQANECSDASCACQYCEAEMQACTPKACGGGGGSSDNDGSSCAVNSSMSCSELIDCTACCDSTADPETCYQDTCAANATQTAVDQYNALVECGNQNGCFEKDDGGDCLANNCEEEVRACNG